MLKAKPNVLIRSLLDACVYVGLRHQFHGVFLSGCENLAQVAKEPSFIACANHTNWWDGFVAGWLTNHGWRRSCYIGQEESHLNRYEFFRYAGVFGVDLAQPKSHLALVRYVAELLKRPNQTVWMFPQGALVGPENPVQAKRGISLISRVAGCRVLPVGLRYEYRDKQHAAVIIEIGKFLEAGPTPAEVAAALESVVQRARRYADPGKPLPGTSLIRAKPSLNERWDQVRAKLGRDPRKG